MQGLIEEAKETKKKLIMGGIGTAFMAQRHPPLYTGMRDSSSGEIA
jgi:hypothetical protein